MLISPLYLIVLISPLYLIVLISPLYLIVCILHGACTHMVHAHSTIEQTARGCFNLTFNVLTQSTRYALVTWNEAIESMEVNPGLLGCLDSVEACGVTLFLRSQGKLVNLLL